MKWRKEKIKRYSSRLGWPIRRGTQKLQVRIYKAGEKTLGVQNFKTSVKQICNQSRGNREKGVGRYIGTKGLQPVNSPE